MSASYSNTTMRSKRQAQIVAIDAEDDNEKSEFVKNREHGNLMEAVDIIIKKTNDNNGRLPHGAMHCILLDLKKLGTPSNQDQLYFLKAKRIAELKNIKDKENNQPPPIDVLNVDGGKENSTISPYNDSNGTGTGGTNTCGKRGRPKNSGIIPKAQQKKLRRSAINEISILYANEVNKIKETTKNSSGSIRTKDNFLQTLILEKWAEYGLDHDKIVSTETIRSRYKRNRLSPNH
jgi:hypothetical protein